MHHPRGALTAALALLWACGSSHAQTSCESISAVVEAKIRATGVTQFSLVTVDAAASGPGRVVGTCAMGAKKILYAVHGAAAAASGAAAPAASGAASGAAGAVVAEAPARPRAAAKPDDNIITECKDGSMSVGGSCKH